MGVTGLWKLIDASGKPVPLEMLENKVLAVDISIWLHQVVKGFQDQKGSAVPNAHLLGLFNRLCKLLYYRIKPVFVFDGGVPMLKRDTIAKRYQSKNKLKCEADRIHQLLMSSLAKEKIVQQALRASPKKTSPKSAISPMKKNIKAIEQDELFKLPELGKDMEAVVDTSTAESDSSSDEENEVNYYRNLKAIDVNSTHFKSLPADVRYDLLSDIKETRKHSSWATIHELPAESNEFCTFQMNRLLKRRKVQVELEETEKELGGKCLTMDVLENLLKEDGIDVDQNIAVGGQMASDENTRYILVRDLKTVIEKSNLKKEELTTIKEEVVEVEQIKPVILETHADIEQSKPSEDIHIIEDDEDDDLQRAIQMSLATEEEVTSFDEVKMTTQQKKVLSKAAQSCLARGYVLEAGMTTEEFGRLVADRENHEEDISIDPSFKYNDSFVVYGKKATVEAQITPDAIEKSDNEPQYNKSVSSDTDMDLVDVPDADFNSSEMNIFPTFLMSSAMSDVKDPSKDFRIEDLEILKKVTEENKMESKSIEIFVKPGEIKQDEEDIFADVFIPNKNIKSSQIVKTDTLNSVNNILKQLEKEKSEILKLDLNDIQLDNRFLTENPRINDDRGNQIVVDGGEDSDETIIDETLHTVSLHIDSIRNKHEVSNAISAHTSSLDKAVGPKPNTIENDIEVCDDKTFRQSNDSGEIIIQIQKPQKLLANVETIELNQEDSIVIDSQNLESIEVTTQIQISTNVKTIGINDEDSNVIESKAIPSIGITTPVELKDELVPALPIIVDRESINPELSIEEAAIKLRENKTEDELIDMMSEISKERNILEIDKNKQDRFSASITEQMSRECMNLLKLFGVPYIIAPMEAEAQCAFLNFVNLTDGTITDDSDIWLFGGQTVYKNFFNQKKNVLEFRMENIEKLYKMDRDKMIQIAFLTGSDYTTGINGIGAVTALEILASFPSTPEEEGGTNRCMSILSGLRKFKNWFVNSKAVTTTPQKHSLKSKLKNIELTDNFPHINVVEAYLYPTVDENLENFCWGYPDAKAIQEFARKCFGWTNLKTDETLTPVLKKLDDRKSQQSITNYFKLQSTPTVKNLNVSKRVKTAINQMGGNLEIDEKPKRTKINKTTNEMPSSKVIVDLTDVNDVKPKAVRNRKLVQKLSLTEGKVGERQLNKRNVKPVDDAQQNSTDTAVIENEEATTIDDIVDNTVTNDVKSKAGRKRKPGQKLSHLQDKVVKRQPSKRKAKSVDDSQSINIEPTLDTSTVIEPSTSKGLLGCKNTAKTRLSDTSHIDKILRQKEVIPQRTKDEQDREDSRLKAAEIFKKSK